MNPLKCKVAKRGKVYLVGAGPGDPKLITLRAIECIGEADIIIYDNLVALKLLDFANDGCEKIYAGKKSGRHTFTQEKINSLLIERAKKGDVVCRLKGGDPFVFGRGGEEALELSKAGIKFEVIPGITAAIAVPAYAGIPVTHRKYSSTLSFITGHEDPTKEQGSIDWTKISNTGTLVFYMGVKNLSKIVLRLMENNRSNKTPIAIIEQGTLPNQKVVTGTLENITREAEKAKVSPPAIIIIGDVVRLRKNLNWFETKPLFNKTIIVTRSSKQARKLSGKLGLLGARVIAFPTIRIEEPLSYRSLDNAIESLETFDWVIFTSVNGVEAFFSRLLMKGKDARSFKDCKIASIGSATARKIEDNRLFVDFSPDKFTSQKIVEGLKKLEKIEDRKILIPSSDIAKKEFPKALRRLGARVTEVTAYRTVPETVIPEEAQKALSNYKVDIVTFTSSSTVKNFVKIVAKDYFARSSSKMRFASIGPVTTETAKNLGIEISIQAKEYTVDGLVKAIAEETYK